MDELLEGDVAVSDPVVEGHRLPHGPLVVPRPGEGDHCRVSVVYADGHVHLRVTVTAAVITCDVQYLGIHC